MDERRHLILLHGEIKTNEIHFCEYNTQTQQYKVIFTNGKTYYYGSFSVQWYRDPEVLNPALYQISRNEALISQELWDTVHQMMKARRRENGNHEVQPFAGLVKCADCGSSLNVSYDARKGKYTGFSCWVYKNYGKERCTSHAIGWVTLNQLVLEDIRRNARWAKVAERDYAQLLIAAKQSQQQKDTERQKRELKRVEKRLGEPEKILNKLYEDRALEKITEERYQSMSSGYEQEHSSLLTAKEKLAEVISASEQVYADVEEFLPLVRQYTEISELNTHILNKLIEKIVVHEKMRDADGNVTQQVDIYYKFIGYINPAIMMNEALAGIASNSNEARPVTIIA